MNDQEYAISYIKAPYFQVGIILIGVFMSILDTSIVNVAIPTMESELKANTDQIQWVITAYVLAIGVLIPISGWMTDKFGAKRLFLFALSTFTIGSALCGMAWNLPSMITFRIIQAGGGGFMLPVANAMIYRIFPPDRRGLVMGLFGITIMSAPAVGPLLSGYFVEYASWRLSFYINVPIGITAILFTTFFLHNFPHKADKKVDIWGFLLSCFGFFLLLYGVNNASSDGWSSLKVVVSIVFGVLLLIILVIVELNTKFPIVDLRTLKNPMFSLSIVITSVVNVIVYTALFIIPIYLQMILGYTALQTGLLMTPGAIAAIVMMIIGGLLFERVGVKTIALIGIVILGWSLYEISWLTANSTGGQVEYLLILLNIGVSLSIIPVTTAGMNMLPIAKLSQGSAISNALREVIASLGTAILASYLSTRTNIHLSNLAAKVTLFSPIGTQLQNFRSTLEHLGEPPTVAYQRSLIIINDILNKQSFVYAMDDVFIVTTILTVLSFFMTVILKPKIHHPS